MSQDNSRVVVTVVGKDKVGIIARVANILADNNANILDISQTIMQGFFTMIMIVDIENASVNMAGLKETLDFEGEKIGVKISAQREDVFQYMHRI